MEEHGGEDEGEEFSEEAFVVGLRFLEHDVGRGRGFAECEGGEAVGGDVEPEDLEGQDWQRVTHDGDYTDGHNGVEVGGEHVFNERENVAVDAAAFFDGVDDGGEVVVFEDDIGDFFGGFGSFYSHGNTDMGVFEGGGVVDAVTGDGDYFSLVSEDFNNSIFVFGVGSGKDVCCFEVLLELLVGELVDVGAR